MKKFTTYARTAMVMLLAQIALPIDVQAEETPMDLQEWGQLVDDMRQAIIEELSARRGLDASSQNLEWLVRSTDDMKEAALISCEISGACLDEAGRANLADNLGSFPDYDIEQGKRNAEQIWRLKGAQKY